MVKGIVRINGASVPYEVAGDGPAFVMVHGHLLDLHQWDDQFDYFAQKYRVLRYDARGYGDASLPPEPFKHAADLRVLLEQLGLERVILMGCSGGGRACIDFVLEYPACVERLILVGTAVTGFTPTNPLPPAVLAMWEAEERGATEEIIEQSLRAFTYGERRTFDQVDSNVRERTRAMTTKLYGRTAVPEAEEQGFEPNAVTRLSEIHVPTLIIVGSEDASLIREIADVLSEHIPNVQKNVIDDAGHHPNMERPQQFNHIVETFLQHKF